MMCVLTSICRAEIKVGASELTDEPAVTRSNEDTDTRNDYLEGDLGGLTFRFDGDNTSSLSATLQILLILTIISLAPSILIMLTSFTRIVIVLHFVRTAVGTQTTPPNQVLIGLALFLTFFIMSPTLTKIYDAAITPLNNGEISTEEAIEKGMEPIREFMFEQMDGGEKDLRLFLDIAGIEEVNSRADVPNSVLIPAFILNELRIAFIIGFLIYIPFLIIDMVVASTLMSMGMMMLPPTTISMPFKILLFVVADGWDLIIGQVVKTFY
ncbi:MAG: flagellar type III secretion system pore protein FliP [Lachnospiraceae bacterium]|nr:flagellar type III secretion system pore protein FliP [Lachnospiraceae bacterium]MBQ6026328.1 flagellar type III secretion system pore protein FliP [Lachnospiraceae bacterium]MBR3484422.1 flagellar type III secretion system pore protein FliP [Lachnospiraceae bacterium]MBR3580273.1 flagellar type III secretion system pore protein FliP [Lachnospiraceae bacterium]MBR4542376.1 flagellar type III secretion system pore protein FliP [Lachnospiraceae bacterium]